MKSPIAHQTLWNDHHQDHAKESINYQLGLLHLAHLLVHLDGRIDERERKAVRGIQQEEKITDALFAEFETSVAHLSEPEVYWVGVDFLNRCTEEQKLCAFVHLYRLAEADSSIHIKEVRFLLYGVKVTHIEFDDVVLSARLTGSRLHAA